MSTVVPGVRVSHFVLVKRKRRWVGGGWGVGGGVQRGRLSEYEHHRKRRKETDLPTHPSTLCQVLSCLILMTILNGAYYYPYFMKTEKELSNLPKVTQVVKDTESNCCKSSTLQ